MFPRSSGILMHISSLPGEFGIGSMGREARLFVDFLHRAGERYWQLLPLVPPGGGASPYMSPSSAAGNPLFIDLPTLVDEGLLSWWDLEPYKYYDVDRGRADGLCSVQGLFEPLRRASAPMAGQEPAPPG